MKILVTGAAGFIGVAVAEQLLRRGDEVIGLDNLNAYYDPALKLARLERLEEFPAFRFAKMDIADRPAMDAIFAEQRPARVVHLAAQAGVRHSLTHPFDYLDANITGFLTILEGCRNTGVEHLVFASTSSVYGLNTDQPFSVHRGVDHPVSLYGATKKANEAMAHSYAHLYRVPITGLRFFTVYGPWGRPDMAAFLFTRKILAGEPIDVFNHGAMRRDFTYVDDIAEGVVRTLDRPAKPNPAWTGDAPDPGSSSAPYRIYNIGNSDPVDLSRFIAVLERHLGKTAIQRLLPLQPGDVPETKADVSDLERDTGFRPNTSIEEGLGQFVAWYRAYYGI